jgi:crotonobetainyl-CoA:carnitine CoA-transferase CaiB-like acyl-CoA transferase
MTIFQDIDIPSSRVNRIDEVFDLPQIQARGMEISMPHALSPSPIHLVGSPFHLSDTPVSYRLPPPALGQHTEDVLGGFLGLSATDLAMLRAKGVV